MRMSTHASRTQPARCGTWCCAGKGGARKKLLLCAWKALLLRRTGVGIWAEEALAPFNVLDGKGNLRTGTHIILATRPNSDLWIEGAPSCNHISGVQPPGPINLAPRSLDIQGRLCPE